MISDNVKAVDVIIMFEDVESAAFTYPYSRMYNWKITDIIRGFDFTRWNLAHYVLFKSWQHYIRLSIPRLR